MDEERLKQIIRALVALMPWKGNDIGPVFCDWCDARWELGDGPPGFDIHAETCPWRCGREAIGESPVGEWDIEVGGERD